MTEVQIGKITRVITKDGRCFIGTLTGYAEVAQGDDAFEEIYLVGCSESSPTLVLQMNNVSAIDQEQVAFKFTS